MKKILPTLSIVLLLAAGLFLTAKTLKSSASAPLQIPAGEQEENPRLRAAWERLRLADPATGEIPAGIELQERLFAAHLPQALQDRSGPDWLARGPWNVGGRTRALAIDVTDENRLLAGSVSGGVWLSLDGGQSWSRRTPLNAHPGCVSIAQDTRPGHTNIWYYLSGEVYGTSAGATGAFYLGDGMFKSIDGGLTWAPVTATAVGNPQSFSTLYQSGWRVITNPADTGAVVYMATIGTVYRSANGGQSWTAVLGGNLGNYSYFADVAAAPSGVMYATMSSDGPMKGIWRSTNGTNWINISPDTTAGFAPVYDRFVMGINPNNENEVYFLGATPGYGHYNNYIDSDDWSSLWKYTYANGDGSGAGGTWENLSANLPNTGTEFDQFACQGGYDLVVHVQPGTGSVFIGGTNIYRSTDGFTSGNNTAQLGGYKIGTTLPFFQIYPGHHPDQHDFLFLPSNPNVMLSACDGGLFRTADCTVPSVTWSSLNRGYQTTQFYTAVIDKSTPNDPMLLGGLQDNGNFFVNSTDPTAPWKQTVNGDGSFGAVAPGKEYYVLSIQQGRVAKVALSDEGTVLAFRRIDPIGPKKDNYSFINPLALDPTDANVLYLPAGNRLYRQTELANINLTGEWDSIAQGWMQYPDTIKAGFGTISAIAVSTANPTHRVYIGTSANKLYRIDEAHTGSPAFTALGTPPVGTAGYVTCIAVDPDNADRVVVAYSNYNIYSLFLSTNAGANWQKVGGNLEANLNGTTGGVSVRWISILPFANGSHKYFCGTSVGLFSTDTLKVHSMTAPGTQWALEGASTIGSSVVDYIETRTSDGLVVAATHGSGMFTANFAPVSGTNDPAGKDYVHLYPNPASDFVQVDLGNQYNGAVAELRLFDQRGQQVRRLKILDGSGRIDLQGLPTGVYLYDLQGIGWRKSGKVMKGN